MNTKVEHPLNESQHMLRTISTLPIGTGFLAFRDIGLIIKSYITGVKTLDFGCGAGRSSRILKEEGLTVVGVDVSKDMIDQAIKTSVGIDFFLIEKNEFTNIIGKFNLIFVSFVLMEIPSKNEIKNLIKKLRNLLDEEGKIIVITASDEFYNSNWLSVDTSSYSNTSKVSGDIVQVYLKDYNVEISDYLWKESDCEQCFNESNMVILKKLKPLGLTSDLKCWVDEYTKAPFVIYLLQQQTQ